MSPLIWYMHSLPFQLEEEQKEFVFMWNKRQCSTTVLLQSYVKSHAHYHHTV